MTRLLKKVFLTIVFLSAFGAAGAQKVNFKVKAPSPVAVGELFRVEFTLNKQPDNPPKLTPADFEGTGIELRAGPSYSEKIDFAISGTNVVSNEQYLYTYACVAKEEGKYSIPAVTVTVNGKEYSTRALPVEVVAQVPQASQQAGQGSAASASSSAVDANSMFLRVVTDKSTVYKGQPVRVMLKLYTRVTVIDWAPTKNSSFNGFWVQELNPQHYDWQRETYNSQIYESKVLRDYLLYPQQSGVLQIEPFDYEVMAQVLLNRQPTSIMDDFMGFGNSMVDRFVCELASAPVKVTVSEWPAGAPSGFNGAVGNFTMTSEFPQGEIYANSSANVSVKITGKGNLPLVQAPTLSTPASFEQYNIKTTESLNKSPEGITGFRQFDYPIIPRAEGDYIIDPVNFVYFNPESERYVTLSTDAYTMRVLPDSTSGRLSSAGSIVSGITREDLKILGQDIHFIKLSQSAGLQLKGTMLISCPVYYVILVVLVLIFVFLLIYLQKRIKELSNLEALKGKRANKVALQRLRAADSYMKAGSRHKFYEELLRALWGYMSDKLNIPVAILTKENVREELLKRNVSANFAMLYTDLISDCEYAQYAPGESMQMQEAYTKALEIISKLEAAIKK